MQTALKAFEMTLPPRASYAMSPLRTPDPDNSRNNSLTLVSLTTKDTSPATTGSPMNRLPLSSIGANNGGLGLRQRPGRQPQGFESKSGPFFNGGEKIKGPPRASLSLGSGGSSLVPSKTNDVNNDVSSSQRVQGSLNGCLKQNNP